MTSNERRNARKREQRAAARAAALGPDAGDQRGKHKNHAKGADHYRWRGGNPEPEMERRRQNANASARRHPERCRARSAVSYAVRKNRLSAARDCRCTDCGEPAQSYDHYLGYDQPLAVEAVCFRCHGHRSRARGEHKLHGRKRITPSLKADGREWREFPA